MNLGFEKKKKIYYQTRLF